MRLSIQAIITGFFILLLFPSQLLGQRNIYRKSARKARKEYRQSLPDSLKKKHLEWGILVSIGGLTPEFGPIENRPIPDLLRLADYNSGRDLSAGLMLRYSIPFTKNILRIQHELSYETFQISGRKIGPSPYGIQGVTGKIAVHSDIDFAQFASLLHVSLPLKMFRVYIHGGASLGHILQGFTDLTYINISQWNVSDTFTRDNRRDLKTNHVIIGGGIAFKGLELEYRYRKGTGINIWSDMKYSNFMIKYFF